jgi:hypothetical protein
VIVSPFPQLRKSSLRPTYIVGTSAFTPTGGPGSRCAFARAMKREWSADRVGLRQSPAGSSGRSDKRSIGDVAAAPRIGARPGIRRVCRSGHSARRCQARSSYYSRFRVCPARSSWSRTCRQSHERGDCAADES